jgi:hypothetical protein
MIRGNEKANDFRLATGFSEAAGLGSGESSLSLDGSTTVPAAPCWTGAVESPALGASAEVSLACGVEETASSETVV